MSGKVRRQFVDTNIFVYAHDITAGQKRERAQALIEDLWQTGNGCISVQVLQEVFVTLTRKVPHPLDSTTAASVVKSCTYWTTHTPNADDVIAAIAIHQRNNISFWDAMIVQSAAQLSCDVLWSEDLNAGQTYQQVLVRNPFM